MLTRERFGVFLFTSHGVHSPSLGSFLGSNGVSSVFEHIGDHRALHPLVDFSPCLGCELAGGHGGNNALAVRARCHKPRNKKRGKAGLTDTVTGGDGDTLRHNSVHSVKRALSHAAADVLQQFADPLVGAEVTVKLRPPRLGQTHDRHLGELSPWEGPHHEPKRVVKELGKPSSDLLFKVFV